jgi:hypothetical protein
MKSKKDRIEKPDEKIQVKTLAELAKQIYDLPLADLTPLQRQDLEQSRAAEFKRKNMKIDDRIRLLLEGTLHLKAGNDVKDGII